MLDEIEPRFRARVNRLIEQVGEVEFRRGVAQMTRYDIESLELDEVVCLYVLARQGRVHPPDEGRRGAALLQTLPGRTPDDAGFTEKTVDQSAGPSGLNAGQLVSTGHRVVDA